VYGQISDDPAVLVAAEEPFRPGVRVEFVRADGCYPDNLAKPPCLDELVCGERFRVAPLFEEQRNGAPAYSYRLLNLVQLFERGAQWLVRDDVSSGPERRRSLGTAFCVASGYHSDVRALGEDLVHLRKHGRTEWRSVMMRQFDV
jgi:hypothetical protein